MSAFADISAALDELTSELGLPTAWENRDFEPTNDTLYLRPTLLPATTEPSGLPDSDEHSGIYQVDVIAPMGSGKGEAIEKADIVANQFKRGKIITHNGVNVWVLSVSRGVGGRDGSWYILPVQISYKAYTDIR